MIKFATAIVIMISLAGCHRAHELRPRLILPGELVGDDFWLSAPYILAVKIVSADPQGSPEPIYQGGPRTLQLIKYEAIVDNVIKGDLPSKNIAFLFFDKLDQRPRYELRPGNRYITSLRSEGKTLRSFADAKQLSIVVNSGSHNQKDLPLELGPAATIAYILLTPGSDCDLRKFALSLRWPPISSVGPQYVNERLKQLQLNSDEYVRDSACEIAATIFWHRPKCLEHALHSSDTGIRRAAARYLNEDDVNLLGLLRSDPSSLFNKAWSDYIIEMFEIYTEDMRPEVRKAACAALRSFAPQRAVEHCR
jgi:hypothetical protein